MEMGIFIYGMMMRKLAMVMAVVMQLGSLALACEVTSTKIVFPTMGTHTAWYCKATAVEKKQALEALAKTACVPKKLKEHGKSPLESEATDVIPYWYTKADAEKAGPLLDLRVTLVKKVEGDSEKKTGISALATGKKIIAMPTPQPNPTPNTPPPAPRVLGIEFEIGAPNAFERNCPPTGCSEFHRELCDPNPSLAELE